MIDRQRRKSEQFCIGWVSEAVTQGPTWPEQYMREMGGADTIVVDPESVILMLNGKGNHTLGPVVGYYVILRRFTTPARKDGGQNP